MRIERALFPGLCLAILSFAARAEVADAKPVDAKTVASSALVSQIKVQPDKAPDCSSLKSIAESVTRDCKTNDAKAVAIYNFILLTFYHQPYANEDGGIPALKVINCYGWGVCGGTHSVQSALWRELGWGWQFVGWPGHTTVEAQYDGRWHYFDAFLKYYAWMPDGKGGQTVAGENDLKAKKKELIDDVLVFDKARGVFYGKNDQFVMIDGKANWRARDYLSCGDSMAGGIPSLSHAGPAESWAGYNHATGNYSMDVNLAPGFSLTNTWDAVPDAWYWKGSGKPPAHSCSNYKDTRNNPAQGLILEPYIDAKPARSYANGTLVFAPDFSNDAVLHSFLSTKNVKFSSGKLLPEDSGASGSVVFRMASPYIMTLASGEAAGADSVEVSVDDGKTFKAVELKEFSSAVKGKLAALIKIGFKESLASLKLTVTVQNNPCVLPYLSPGKNTISVSVADPTALGNNKLVVTYAYRLGMRTSSFEQLCEQGKRVARQVDAAWSDKITYVQKTFTAKDLPAKFDIDCPTPKGKYPVYPRMLFMRREVLAPSASPLSLPDGAVVATVGEDQELLSLPNPFLVGTEPPPLAK